MDTKKSVPPSRLFGHSILDVRDEQEDRYEKATASLQSLMAGKGEKELNDALNVTVAKDAKVHEDICTGFVVLILTEPESAQRHYRHLSLVSRDGLHCVINELTRLVLDKYLKLKDEVRRQLLWFIREMIKNQVQNIDGLCWTLMRQIAGGDLSQKNLWLADTLMDIYTENRAWLEKFQFLLHSVVYTYLRIIEDHAHANLTLLRSKEVNFVVSLIRDRFSEVINIGRDLVRLLQNIARVPEIEQLWNDILYNPTSLAPTFTGITQIMNTRTSRRFLQSRITPDMEKKLVYLTSQVRFGSHKRYQDWFQKSYLGTMESQTLRCDLIRFIVGVIHPTNELLCSDIIPRWAVIGWLLTTCTNPVAASNAKLALFYDWLFFDAEKDNIMNIEPAILVMHHSMRPHPAITATLLDFLCRIIQNFYPAGSDKVRNGIYSSLRQIVDKKVLPSLSPLFDNQRLDRELRAMLKERFGVFLAKEEADRSDPGMIIDKDDIISTDVEPGAPAFSDDEDDDDLPTLPSYEPADMAAMMTPQPLQPPSISSAVATVTPPAGTSQSAVCAVVAPPLIVATPAVSAAAAATVSSEATLATGSKQTGIASVTGTTTATSGKTSYAQDLSAPPNNGHSTIGTVERALLVTDRRSSQTSSLPGNPSNQSGLLSSNPTDLPSLSSLSTQQSSPVQPDPPNQIGNRIQPSSLTNQLTVNNQSNHHTNNQTGYHHQTTGGQLSTAAHHRGHHTSNMTNSPSTTNHNSNGEGCEEDIIEKLEQLREERSSERRCEIMDQLVQILIQEQADGEETRQVAEKFSDILRDQFEGKIFPEVATPENIEDSVGQPLFVVFRTLCEISEIDPNRQPILSVLAELYGLQPRLGYYLLYFLNTYNKLDSKSKANLYKDLCEAIDDNNSLDICLVNDMRQCQEDDVNLFVYLVPDIYTLFTKTAIGNVDLLYLVVSCVDGRQIQTLVSHIIARDFVMFKKDSFQPVINISLSWETFEQYALWQLILSHEITVDSILPLIPRLCYEQHAEALTHFMHLLKREKPSAELIKHLMSREPTPNDRFVTTVLSCWLNQPFEDKKLADLIGSQLCKQASPAGGKRKRTLNTNKTQNSLGALAEMTLGHLDYLRQTTNNYEIFTSMRSMQQALQTVRNLCTDYQKKKFSDLFALAESESEEDSNPKPKSSSKSSKSASSTAKSPGKPRKGATTSNAGSSSGNAAGSAKNSDTSGLSSDTEDEPAALAAPAPPPPPTAKSNKGRKSSSSTSKNQRKRTNKVSYKEMVSTDETSDDDELKKSTPKKRRKASSESD